MCFPFPISERDATLWRMRFPSGPYLTHCLNTTFWGISSHLVSSTLYIFGTRTPLLYSPDQPGKRLFHAPEKLARYILLSKQLRAGTPGRFIEGMMTIS